MSHTNSAIEHYHSLRPIEYPIVERLQIDQEVCRERYFYQLSLVITLRSLDDADKNRLVLSFSKVRELNLNPGPTALQISFLNIVSLENQWEGVKYKVFETEQDIEFSFLCDNFTATVV